MGDISEYSESMKVWPLWLGLLGCSPEESDKESSDDSSSIVDVANDTGDRTNDTGEADDTATPSDDTGESDDTGGLELVAADVSGEAVVCEDPEARTEFGPMQIHDGGSDWSDQNGQENLWSVYAGQGLAVEDFDGDGWLDIFLPNADADQLYMGSSSGLFEDQSTLRLPASSDVGVGATAVDVEGDGDIDIFVSIRNETNRLLINDGTGHFVQDDAPWLMDQGRMSSGSSWADIDRDGDLDVFVANYANWDLSWLEMVPTYPVDPSMDALWQNQGDGEFINIDDWIEPMIPVNSFAFASGWWDYDLDGWLDLIIVSDHRGEYDWAASSHLLRNRGDRFDEVSEETHMDLEVEGMGLAVGDLNKDGFPDFVVQAWDTYVMMSDGLGGFYEASASMGMTSSTAQEVGWGADVSDLNNDGLSDLMVAYGLLPPDEISLGPIPEIILGELLNMNRVRQPDALHLQQSDGLFVDAASDWGIDDTGVSRGFVLADLNRDGWLDIIKRDMMGPSQIYMSRCGSDAWFTIRLQQTGMNPNAVGARIDVRAGDQEWTRWIQAGSTNLSSGGPMEVHFGFGDLEQVDSISVTWPDQRVSMVERVDTRQHLVISRR